jgi:ribosome recycling factor
VRLVHKKVEDGRVEVRNIRRDILEQFRAMEKSKDISQDESKRAQEQLQKMTDQYVGEMDALGADKEKEVMEV